MAAGGVELGEDSRFATLPGIERRHQTGAAGADNDRFKLVRVDHLVLM